MKVRLRNEKLSVIALMSLIQAIHLQYASCSGFTRNITLTTSASAVTIVAASTVPTTLATRVPTTVKSKFMGFSYVPIESSVDLSIDPCQDFYAFACDNWGKHTSIGINNTFQYQEHEIDEYLNRTLYTAVESNSYPKWVNSAINYYKSCTKKEKQKKFDDIGDVINYLMKLGGWPILGLNAWDKKKYDVNRLAGRIFPIILAYLTQNESPESSVVSQELYSLRTPYNLAVLDKMVTTLSTTLSKQQLKRDRDEIRDLEERLRARLRRIIPKSEMKTIAQLQKEIPNLNWLTVLKQVYFDEDINITSSTKLLVRNYAYLKITLNKLLGGTISNRTLANFIGWLAMLDKPLPMPEYLKQAPSQDILQDNQMCYNQVKDRYSSALDYLFVQQSGSVLNATRLAEFERYCKLALRVMINSSKWLSKSAKSAIISKLLKMTSAFGYPGYFASKESFDKIHKRFPDLIEGEVWSPSRSRVINSLSYFQLVKNAKQDYPFLDSIRKPNSYYDKTFERFVIHLPLLRPPFHYPKGASFLNYGTIGNIISNALQTAFAPWNYVANHTTSKNRNEYYRRAACFEKQYRKYSATFIRSFPQDENDADIPMAPSEPRAFYDSDVLKQGFSAYKLWRKQHKEDSLYRGLEQYTAEQMFFISYASTMCSNSIQQAKTAFGKYQIPNYFRVIGTISNSEDFTKAFSCQKRTPMNPKKKCIIW